jgi:hypothetical protein
VVTADMARRMMVWAAFGKPNEREWVPTKRQRDEYAANDGLYSSGYRLFAAEPSDALRQIVTGNEAGRAEKENDEAPVAPLKQADYKGRLWKGWLLPSSAADTWFSAGSAAYYRDLEGGDLAQAMENRRAEFRAASAADPDDRTRFLLEESRGALALDAIRQAMGDDRFFALMQKFFTEHRTKRVAADAFLSAAGADAQAVVRQWLVAARIPNDAGGPMYLLSSIHPLSGPISNAVIVYGTVTEAGANRYAAEQLQKHLLDWYEGVIPIRRDFEVTEAEMRERNVIFVGRPETNSALAAQANALDLVWQAGDFTIQGKHHASEREALALAATNPANAKRMVLVLAGNSALETVRLARLPAQIFSRDQFAVYDFGKRAKSGFLR